MNKTLGMLLIVYSRPLADPSCLTHYLAPALARPTLITGLVGGLLCLRWEVLALRGKRGKALPLLTLIPVCYVMLSQTVLAWLGGPQEVLGRRPAAVMITVLFVISLAMLLRITYAGLVFEGDPANPTHNGEDEPRTTRKPTTQNHAAKRA